MGTPLRAPLLLPASAFAGGIALSSVVPFRPAELIAPACAFAVLAIVSWRFRSPWLARTAIAFAFVFAGALTAVLHRRDPPPELDAGPREEVILGGCVVEPPFLYEDRQQFVLELAPKARVRVSLYLREGETAPRLAYGEEVDVAARVRRTRNFANPGSFDQEGYLARRNVFWIASASSATAVRKLDRRCGSRFQAAIFRIREAAIQRLDRLYAGDSYSTGMMRAILIGDQSRVQKVWTEHFRFTGTYHAIVISGLHLAAIAAVVLLAFRLLPALDFCVLPLAGSVAWLYALVTGWQTPVVRAAAGLTLYLIARFFFRRRSLLNLLSAVALAFLALDPHQLFEASFQLSFLSVAAIAALAIPLLDRTSQPLVRALAGLADRDRDIHLPPKSAQFRIELRLLAETVSLLTGLKQRTILILLAGLLRAALYVYELAAVSAAVQAGLVLPMVIYFHRVSITGLSANLVVVPLMSVIVPAGFLAVLTNWSLPAAAAGKLLDVSRAIVELHVGLEPPWRIPDPPAWIAVAIAVSLVGLGAAVRSRPLVRRTALAAAACGILLLLYYPFRPRLEPGVLELTAIDVAQGESLFVAFPGGKTLLMDAGGFPSFGRKTPSRLDSGEDIVSPYLWSRRIRRLDIVAMSHAHDDHMGGMASVLANFRPAELWTGATPEAPSWQALRDKAKQLGIRIRPLEGGETFDFGGARITVLAPPPGYMPGGEPRNNDSLALLVRYRARSFLIAGEIEREIESDLLARNALTRADVLKVAHHGSRTSTTEGFLDRVRPSLALVSAGFQNRYNYPHPDVVRRLAQTRTTLLGTNLWGMISVRTDGFRIWADTYRWSCRRGGRQAPFP